MKNQAWKNKLLWGTAVALVFSSAAGAAAVGAASDKANGKAEAKVEAKAETKAEANAETTAETTVQAKDETTVTVTNDTTVTDAVYNNGNTHGLLNAIKNLEGKSAQAKVEALLELRGVTAEEIAAALEAQGDIEAAVVAQEEAAAQQPTDVEAVKKLAKLLNKSGEVGVKAFVNGKQTKFDVKPFIKSGRTLVPFRAIAASLKAEVTYETATKTVTVIRGDVTVKLTLGSDVALVNGKEVKLDVPAQSVKGRTVIPMRFLSEALGAKVSFDAETQSVIVTE